MKILLFNRNEQYIATLKGVLSAKHTEELNGENVLEIETLDEIEKNQRLIYKDKYGYWHEFIVKGVEEERVEEGIIRKVFAEHSFYETWGDYVEDKRPYNVPANIALENALGTTRWEVGIVDDLGIGSTNFYHISAKEAVQKVAETWQGELRYRIEVSGNRITGRYVDLLASRGQDLGKRFTYTKDLISITKTVHRDDVITALYGYGKGEEIVDEEGQATGGYGRRIDFADINNGKAYVENLEAKEIWGRLNPDGTKAHVFGKVEFDDVEDPHELLELTKEKLKELSQPHVTYEAKVIDLKALGIEHEGVELGDWVGIVDKEFNPPLRLKARVIKIVRDLLEPENTEIVLGNFIPTITDSWLEQEKYISNFRDKQGVWDRSNIISPDLKISANYLDEIINRLNDDLNSRGGYVYLSEDGKGIITYDKPIEQDPTKAIQITGGAFRIANSKLPNGEWNWRTFGTGDGFIADLITAGKLKGGKVHFDLTNGTFLIGNNIEDYNLYFDGSNLSIKLSNNKSIETALTELETGLQDYADQAINTVDTKIDNKVSEINLTLDGITQRVSSVESSVSTIDDEVTSLETRIQTAEQKITPTAIVQTVRESTAYQNDLDGIDQAISTVDTKVDNKVSEINLTLDGITSRVSSTESSISTINTKLSETTSEINALQGQIELKVEQKDIEKAINEIEVGGRNLLRNSDFKFGFDVYWDIMNSSPLSNFTITSEGLLKVTKSSDNADFGKFNFISLNNLGDVENLTVSAWVKGNGEFTIRFGGSSSHSHIETVNSDTIKKYVFHIPKSRFGNGNFIISVTSGEIFFDRVKAEIGDKSTDWTPAPEDIDQEVSALQSRVQSAEQKITPTAIVSTVRQSTAYQNDLGGKVSKNNIISEINQSAEQVQINANRVKIGTGTTFQEGEIYTWQKYVGKTWSQVISSL